MKCKLIISLLCCCVFNIAVSAQTTPTARQVVRQFYSHYNLSAFTVQRVEFQKKKNDWYVVTMEYEGGKFSYNHPVLFYSGKEKKYLDLSIDRNGAERTVDVSEYLDDYTLTNFDLQPYYGYPGWYLDVIKDIGKQPVLSDDRLYGLGRAYTTASVSPLVNTGRDVAPGGYLDLPFSESPLMGKDLEDFKQNADSAIACFGRLAARNPRYQTIVGDIRQKYANEIVSRYHLLLTFAPAEAEQTILPQGIYSPSVLDTARGILNECPQGSVFLSLSDNDFYPLLYLQKTEGLRRDVYLTNYSVMAVDRFIYRLTLRQFDAVPLPVSMDTLMYRGEENEYVYRTDGPDTLTMGGLMDILKTPLPDGLGARTLQASALKLPLSHPQTLRFSGVYYLLRNHLVLLDIISQLDKRPLCMSGYFTDDFQQMNEWFERQTYIGIFRP